MVDHAIESLIQDFVRLARKDGIPVIAAHLFGSHARGDARAESDIDVVVLVDSLRLDEARPLTSRLWMLRARTDSRIEPVLATVEEWAASDCRIVLDYAKQDASEITLPPLHSAGKPRALAG